MLKITTDEALKRFAADPQAAAAFDAATAEEYPQATSRRDAVQWILTALNAKLDALQASSQALRAKLASARATRAARGRTSDSISRLSHPIKAPQAAPTRAPDIKHLTGLAKVAAAFKAQNAFNSKR